MPGAAPPAAHAKLVSSAGCPEGGCAHSSAQPLTAAFSALFLQLCEDLQSVLCLPSHHHHPSASDFSFMPLAASAPPQEITTFPSLVPALDKPQSQRCPERRPADSTIISSFTTFVSTILLQPALTPITLFLALFYAVKILRVLGHPGTTEDEREARQASRQEFINLFLSPVPIATAYKMFQLCMAEAVKALDDNPFQNHTWASIGMDLDLNRLERWFLAAMQYDIVPSQKEWTEFLDHMSGVLTQPPTKGVSAFVHPEQFACALHALHALKAQHPSCIHWDDCPPLDSSSSASSPHSISPTLSVISTSETLEPGSPMSWRYTSTCSLPQQPANLVSYPIMQGYYPAPYVYYP